MDDGAIFIDQLVNALQFVMNQVGSCGIRLVSMVLHVEQHLNAHHSPAIFHVQQDITKGTSAAMSSKIRATQQAIDKFEDELKSRLVSEQKSPQIGPALSSVNLGIEPNSATYFVKPSALTTFS